VRIYSTQTSDFEHKSLICRGVHGNGNHWDPMSPMGFSW